MSKKVQFGVTYMAYGTQIIDLPDDIDANDIDAVINYVESVFPDLPLPVGDFVNDSDELDYDSIEVVEE